MKDVIECTKSNDEEKILVTLNYFQSFGIVSDDCYPMTSKSECKLSTKTCDVKEAFLKYKCKNIKKLTTIEEIKTSISSNGPVIA